MRFIKKDFILIFSILSVLSLILLGVGYRFRFESNKNLIASRENYIIKLQSQVVNKEFINIINDLILMSEHTKLSNIFNSSFSENNNSYQNLALEFKAFSMGRGHSYDQIRYIGEKGDEIIRINLKTSHSVIVNKDSLQNKKNRYYFKDIKKLNSGDIYISPMDLNIEHGKIEQPIKPIVRIGTPVDDLNGNKKGIVIINYLAKTVLDAFDESAGLSFGQNFFLNKDGYWLRGNDFKKNWAFMYPDRIEQTFGNSFPEEWKKISANKSGQFNTKNGLFTYTTVYPLPTNFISSSGSHRPLQKPILSTQYYWKLISFVPKDKLKSLAIPIWNEFIIMAIIFNLLLAILSWVFVKSKTKRKIAEEALKKSHDNLESIVFERTNELVNAKEQAEESERKTLDILQTAMDGFWIIDLNGKLIDVNEVAHKMLGYTREEILKLNVTDIELKENAEQIQKHLQKIVETGEDRFETKHRCRNGRTIDVEISMKIQPAHNLIVTFVSDITERKQAEKGIIESQRLNAIGEMAASVAHDFNNSLQAMMGNIEVVKLKTNLSDTTLKYLNNVESIIVDVTSRVKSLQRFGRTKQDRSEYKLVNLNTIIGESIIQARPLWKDNAEKAGITININADYSDIPKIACNKGELKTSFHNIIKNSVEAMPKGGTITIVTGIKDKKIFVTVTDTGIGMDEDTKVKVFQPFYSTKGFDTGRGLGMSGVFSIVRECGGDIFVRTSELGKGTTIEIVFPFNKQNEIKEEKIIEEKILDDDVELRILWVEDDFIIRQSLPILVESLGHKCDIASSGIIALEYLEKNTYDVVITDIGMPEMSGWELADIIKNKFGNKIKVIVVSGWSIDEAKKNKHGVKYVLGKPFKTEELKQVLLGLKN